jgi:hypothetical protein
MALFRDFSLVIDEDDTVKELFEQLKGVITPASKALEIQRMTTVGGMVCFDLREVE